MKISSLLFRCISLAPLGITLSAALFALPAARAAIYTETGDAGDLTTTAQAVATTGSASTALTAIAGTITLTNGISDGDMFKIYIADPSNFSATTTGFAPGVNAFDTQLFLFTVDGYGLLANDDDPSGSSQSTIPVGAFTGAAGYYDLLITGGGRFPGSVAGLIFPNYTDGTTDPTDVYGPTGPGGGSPLSGYAGNSSEGGKYSIALTGAAFGPAAVAAVPEPSVIVLLVSGFGLMMVAVRRRRSFAVFPTAS